MAEFIDAHGNLLKAEVEALANSVNTVGVMGKGIALQFKNAFPANFKAYEAACNIAGRRTRQDVRLRQRPAHDALTGSSTSRPRVIGAPGPAFATWPTASTICAM